MVTLLTVKKLNETTQLDEIDIIDENIECGYENQAADIDVDDNDGDDVDDEKKQKQKENTRYGKYVETRLCYDNQGASIPVNDDKYKGAKKRNGVTTQQEGIKRDR